MAKETDCDANYQHIKIAILIAIILGVGTSIFFMVIEKESYSAIYIVPNSITQNPEDNTVTYVYGVISSESNKMDYILDTYLGGNLIKTKLFSLNSGETLEERVTMVLPVDAQYPENITLNLKTASQSESVHFWIDNTTP